MLLEAFEVLGFAVSGALAGIGLIRAARWKSKKRCTACLWLASERFKYWDPVKRDWVAADIQGPRCKEPPDPRCVADYCSVHCRKEQRCKGACFGA